MSERDSRPSASARGTEVPRLMEALDRTDALNLLRSVPLGRLVFTQRALPAIRPLNHLLDGEDIIVRLGDGSALASLTTPRGSPGAVVAYEADVIDLERHVGWSVVVTGYARLVEDPADLDRYQDLLHPWVARTMTDVLRIRAELITGFRLTPPPGPHPRTG